MPKVIFIANHAGFSKFNAPYFSWFRQQGWEVHNISPGLERGEVDKQIDIKISRNPITFTNIIAVVKTIKIIKKNKYDLIHCHTPVGGLLGRLSKIFYRNTKLIYTAHGFHFFKKASIVNWILYYPVEKLLSKLTDAIVTINQEDFKLAKDKFFSKVYKIDGVGVNLSSFYPPLSKKEIQKTRQENGFNEQDYIIIYMAQFIKRKNHIWLLNSIDVLKKAIPNLKICFVGDGVTRNNVEKIVNKLRLKDTVEFLGWRTDVAKLYQMSDLLISVSKQEGFPINVVEGLATGLPVLCSEIRGHSDIADKASHVKLFSLNNRDEFEKSIINIFKHNDEINKDALHEEAKIFAVENSIHNMAKIYDSVIRISK